ncbi:ATP-dependent DNA helicase II subunit [Lachnellula suecica]|uniref:ATP-dependent DNA helicase II subunit 2 n=1 Tax=Lachnellula suecica TaxID=602035 RepID=A0A8T9C320_9HELO|nr:ATP-dependent DNA helicase II subunit [Lachnellula suecica]
MSEPGKEATIYIVDVGETTGDCHNGRTESDLDYGMQYVWDKIATTLAASKTTLATGVIAVRSDETANPMGSEEGYENIAVLKELGPIHMTHLAGLQNKIKPSSTDFGDAISAIVVALEIIAKFTTLKTGKLGKFRRKIVLLTDGQGHMDGSGLEPIAARINELEVELVVVGTDFDDSEFGVKEEDKTTNKRNNEATLKALVESCTKGLFATTAEALESRSTPEVKVSKPYKSFAGRLSLGDYKYHPDTALYIDVQRYFRTKQAKPVGASSFVTRSDTGNGQPSGQSSHTVADDTEMTDAPDLSAVRNTFGYQVNDPTLPGGKRDVAREELAKGYLYGSTAVAISESEENVAKLDTFESFEIIGFIPSDKYERYLNFGECNITVAQSVNDKAKLALSSLIHALHELESYAVARLVSKDGKQPQLLLMAPTFENDMEGLLDVPLPFAEDIRVYRFPPLDRVITTSGATMKKHRNLPNEDLTKAMSDYVDSMDISSFGKNDEGYNINLAVYTYESTEYMPIEDTWSPAIHRTNQAIRTRAVEPSKPVEEAKDGIFMQWSQPPDDLVKKAAPALQKLVKAADVKQVAKKAKGRRYGAEKIIPLSGLDVNSLLDSGKPRKITIGNSIPEFKDLLRNTASQGDISNAVDQMAKIVREMFIAPEKDFSHGRVLENIRVIRSEMIELEMPEIYNSFIQDFKKTLATSKGPRGDPKEFWYMMKKARLGLIDKVELEHSEIPKEEAAEFLTWSSELPSRAK